MDPETAVCLNFDTEPLLAPMDTAIPCGLIVNELVTNAVRHAFPGGGAGIIRVGLRAVDNATVLLSIRDNGVGFDIERQRTPSESLGLRLVDLLVDQLHGTASLETSAGSSWEVRFPVEPV
jgi:two-component sensor histidine kinase